MSALMEGQDVLAVMPTGQGKSLCFQLPAMLLEGVTLVISPLISLMQDQVASLQRLGLPATFINSTLSWEAQRERLDGLEAGAYKLVYVAPERFRSQAFVRQMQRLKVALFAVDEAHCLSQWGHDFRPDYIWLGKAVEALGRPTVGAFTATATPFVREDILTHLGMREPRTFVTGFARPNLSLGIYRTARRAEKYEHLKALIERQKTGIIYCATRKRVDEVAAQLMAWKLPHVAYHGGLGDTERQAAQNAFMSGERDLAVATNAFGMGIDRRDIRFVAHFEIPGSIEAYYQEVGRAGRDGEPSECALYFNFADRSTQDFFIEGANPTPELIRDLYANLLEHADNDHVCLRSQSDLKEDLGGRGVNFMALSGALSWLRRLGYIERFDVPGRSLRGTRLLKPEVTPQQLEMDEQALARKREADGLRLEKMIGLCQTDGCRHRHILDYFGEGSSEDCGQCDRCKIRRGLLEGMRPLGPDETEIARKALSGVARMSQRIGDRWRGKATRGSIIKMLIGQVSEHGRKKGYHELSTFGLLRKQGGPFLHALFDAMEAAGWLENNYWQSGDQNIALVGLSDKGAEVMRGDTTAELAWPEHVPTAPSKSRAKDIDLAGGKPAGKKRMTRAQYFAWKNNRKAS